MSRRTDGRVPAVDHWKPWAASTHHAKLVDPEGRAIYQNVRQAVTTAPPALLPTVMKQQQQMPMHSSAPRVIQRVLPDGSVVKTDDVFVQHPAVMKQQQQVPVHSSAPRVIQRVLPDGSVVKTDDVFVQHPAAPQEVYVQHRASAAPRYVQHESVPSVMEPTRYVHVSTPAVTAEPMRYTHEPSSHVRVQAPYHSQLHHSHAHSPAICPQYAPPMVSMMPPVAMCDPMAEQYAAAAWWNNYYCMAMHYQQAAMQPVAAVSASSSSSASAPVARKPCTRPIEMITIVNPRTKLTVGNFESQPKYTFIEHGIPKAGAYRKDTTVGAVRAEIRR